MIKKNKNKILLPKIISFYLIKEFFISLIIISLIFFSLIFLITFIEELTYFKNFSSNRDTILKVFTLSILKSPSLFLNISQYIFLFSSVFFFIKLSRSKQVTSIYLAGLSSQYTNLIPSIFSFFLGVLIILTISPFTAKLTEYYEIEKNKHLSKNNLIIMNSTGLWIKDSINDNVNIFHAESIIENNFSKLKNLSIVSMNSEGDFIYKINSETANIKGKKWILNNANIIEKETQVFKKKYVLSTNFNLNDIKNYYSNFNIYSVWNLSENIKKFQNIGYYGQDFIISLNKLITLPILLFSMVSIAGYYSILFANRVNNYLCALISISAGIFFHYITDLSIAFGKSGKIPIVVSVWLPILIIVLFAFYNLLKKYE